MMKKMLAIAVALFALTACGGDDDTPEITGGEEQVRYFTITNGDPQYVFTYMGGQPVRPTETTQKITLNGDVADYPLLWHIEPSESPVKRTLHIDMMGKPYNITENYTVRYE